MEIEAAELERWRAELPELPQPRAGRFMELTGLPEAEVEVLVQSRALADFFEAAAQKADPRKVANYVLGPCCARCPTRITCHHDPARWAMKPEALAELVRIVDQGLISAKITNDIFGDLFLTAPCRTNQGRSGTVPIPRPWKPPWMR